MGAVLADELGEAIYSIAVVCYQGECASNAWRNDFTPERIAPARPDSLEAGLHRRGLREAFLDLRADEREDAFVMSGLEHAQERCVNWRRVFDGVYCVDRMEAAAFE